MSKTQKIRLESRLDFAGASLTYDALKAARGQAVEIDAAEVKFVGALALQILMSARTSWHDGSLAFSLVAASPEFRAGLACLGADEMTFANQTIT